MNDVCRHALALLMLTTALGCHAPASDQAPAAQAEAPPPTEAEAKLAKYTTVRLTSDLAALSDSERQMVPLLIEAAEAMDEAFWMQAYGDKEALLASIEDPGLRRFAEINYGPWDRLAGNAPFVDGVGPKPKGANLYPADVTAEEIEAAANADELKGLYSLVRRTTDGGLEAVPYSVAFADSYGRAAAKLREAAVLAEDVGLKRYLELRADALLSDDYRASDLAWMDMKTNGIDVVIGPIESYEDQLFGAKTSSEAYVLFKDREWSERLSRYAALLPGLQRGLPVDDAYKTETPGSGSDLNAYDVVYYAGDCNSGSKTIAINLPNDETVQLEKGTRRLQLKNTMRAKFDEILVPIASVLVAPQNRREVSFDAFFANTMFHEVAHGLGIKQTITGKGSVREALKEHASALEEGKADVLGLYMVTSLHEQGELGDVDLTSYYTTFLASIFRSIRFGSSSAHGVANLIRFNYFQEKGAFSRDEEAGTYSIDMDRMQEAIDGLSEAILRLQGDGDHAVVTAFVEQYGEQGEELTADLARLSQAGIAVDIVFEQGMSVLTEASGTI